MNDSKIGKDHFYGKIYESHGLEFVQSAGYYEDSGEDSIDLLASVDLNCTPFEFIKRNLDGSKKPCILATSGSFCPIHDGHIEMMEFAKKAAEIAGYNVIGGYMAPDHDEYVSRKVTGALNINQRMEIMIMALRNHQWLRVDPWAGIFPGYATNFTDIIRRLQLVIHRATGQEIPIFYVCGGDNARFARTFMYEGHCVIVDRPGHVTPPDVTAMIDGYRIIKIFNDNPMSSTMVRNSFVYKNKQSREAIVRKEGLDPREDEIILLLRKYFDKVHVNEVEKQRADLGSIKGPIISLDPLISLEHNLAISRVYDAFGTYFIEYGNRPGTEPLEDQVKAIPQGNYFLMDDDVHTGSTMNYVKDILQDKGINISGNISFTKSQSHQEVLDCRDFLIGNDKGGFVVQDAGLVVRTMEGTTVRAPYVYPYVCPYTRASISDPLAFSAEVWRINWEFLDFLGLDDIAGFCRQKYESLLKIKSK